MRRSRLTIRRVIAVALGLLACAPAPAHAQAVTLVSGPDYLPYTDPSLPQGGMLTEMVIAAFAAAGMPTDPVSFQPWKRGYVQVQTFRTDATFPYVKTAEREQEMAFSDSLFDTETVAVFAAGTQRDYRGPDSLRGLTLCVPLGYAMAPAIEPMARSGDLTTVQNSDVEGCLRQVAAGRVDVFIGGNLLVAHVIRRKLDGSRFRFGGTVMRRGTLHLIVSKSNPRAAIIMQAFNRGLGTLRETGAWTEIVNRHLAYMW